MNRPKVFGGDFFVVQIPSVSISGRGGTMDQAPEKLAYSIQEAVAATSISKSNLYARIASGEIIASKVGRRTLISARQLRKLVGG